MSDTRYIYKLQNSVGAAKSYYLEDIYNVHRNGQDIVELFLTDDPLDAYVETDAIEVRKLDVSGSHGGIFKTYRNATLLIPGCRGYEIIKSGVLAITSVRILNSDGVVEYV